MRLGSLERATALAAAALLFATSSAPARADTFDSILAILVTAGVVDPAVKDARPLIECLVKHDGNPVPCVDVQAKLAQAAQAGKDAAGEQAKAQAKAFVPEDPAIQAAVAIIGAANRRDWLDVLELTGTDLLFSIACKAGLSVAGPMQGFICNGPFQDVAKLAKPVVREVLVVFGDPPPDIWRLITLVANLELACKITPSFPGKDEACGTLAKALAAIGGLFVDAAKYGGKLVVSGADAVENWLFGDDSHMPYDRYYALYWLPWLDTATTRCLFDPVDCAGLYTLNESIWDTCVDYFDSHNQYRDTAKKTCNDLRYGRFTPSVKATAKGMIGAAKAHASIMRPFARLWAVENAGKDTLAQHKAFYEDSCAMALRKSFPLPVADPLRCEAIRKSPAYANLMFKSSFDTLIAMCHKNVAKQTPSPSSAEIACKLGAPTFVAIVEEEKAAFTKTLQALFAQGCTTPAGWTGAGGLKLVCGSYAGLGACLAGLKAGNEQKRCAVDNAKADAKLAKSVVADLGAKRCRVEGAGVTCTRPWKVEDCKAIVAGVSYPPIAKSQLACNADLADYQAKVGVARSAMNQLNGIGRVESSPSDARGAREDPAALGAQCTAPGDDKLAIRCRFAERWLAKVKATPAISFGECASDPGHDGSDAPCYRMPLMMTQVADAPAVAGVAAAPLPGGRNLGNSPLPPPATGRVSGASLGSALPRDTVALPMPGTVAQPAPMRGPPPGTASAPTPDWGAAARAGMPPPPPPPSSTIRTDPAPLAGRAAAPLSSPPSMPILAPAPSAARAPPPPPPTTVVASAAAASIAATQRELAVVACTSPQGGLRFTCPTRVGYDRCEALRRERRVEQCTLFERR